MIRSMTAFARVQCLFNGASLTWELKSVNHRYLEVSFKLPEGFRHLEMPLRQAMRPQIQRGKIDCFLRVEGRVKQPNLTLNQDLATALLQIKATLNQQFDLGDDFGLSHLMNWPGIIENTEQENDQLAAAMTHLFQQGLDQLILMRKNEGAALMDHLNSKLEKLAELIGIATAITATHPQRVREKLQQRLQALPVDFQENRIEQEVALLLTKLEVREELDRLQTHVQEVTKIIHGNEEASGRRLDFLMQELNREANTLTSKSDMIELTQTAVEMKVVIEQMREQIQNIE